MVTDSAVSVASFGSECAVVSSTGTEVYFVRSKNGIASCVYGPEKNCHRLLRTNEKTKRKRVSANSSRHISTRNTGREGERDRSCHRSAILSQGGGKPTVGKRVWYRTPHAVPSSCYVNLSWIGYCELDNVGASSAWWRIRHHHRKTSRCCQIRCAQRSRNLTAVDEGDGVQGSVESNRRRCDEAAAIDSKRQRTRSSWRSGR